MIYSENTKYKRPRHWIEAWLFYVLPYSRPTAVSVRMLCLACQSHQCQHDADKQAIEGKTDQERRVHGSGNVVVKPAYCCVTEILSVRQRTWPCQYSIVTVNRQPAVL
jgi:hypothetical protein